MKKIIGLSVVLLGLIAVILVFAVKSAAKAPEEASWNDPVLERTLTYSRIPEKHFLFTEYERAFVTRSKTGNAHKFPLEKDTGGNCQINIYRDANGDLLLRDRLRYYSFATNGMMLADSAVPKRKATYIGRFDRDDAGHLAFLSAEAKAETEPVN